MRTLKNVNILVIEPHEQVTTEELDTTDYAVRRLKNQKLKIIKDNTGILSGLGRK